MKIVVLNNRYHVTGGPERYLFGIQRELETRGHEVIPFAVRYARNEATPWARYFVAPPGGSDAVYFRDVKGPIAKARLFARSVYSPSSRRRLAALLADEKPDLVYVIIVANYLSPSVLLACRDAGVPVAMRLSDFHLRAPCYTCFDGIEACDLCLHGTRLHAVRKRCVQGSRAVSLARVAGMAVHDRLGLYDVVERFVAPSRFLRDKMIATGIDPDRIAHIPSFVPEIDAVSAAPACDRDGFLYVGRLDPEKGVARLLDAWSRLDVPSRLRIVGSTETPEARRLARRVRTSGLERVEFLGERSREEVAALMGTARAVVVPSLCYENLPIVAIEAMAHSAPIVAHRIGSLPEVVDDGVTGLLCEVAEPDAMAQRLSALATDDALVERLGAEGRRVALERYRPSMHVARLLSLFDELTDRRARVSAADGLAAGAWRAA